MPEPLTEFTARGEATWGALEDALRADRRTVRHDPAMVRWRARAYRQVVADLAFARRRFPGDPVTERLEALARNARSRVYAHVGERTSVRAFASRGFWRRVVERPVFLLLSALLLFGPGLGVAAWAHSHPRDAGQVAQVSPLTAGIGEGQMRDPDTQKVTATGTNAAFSTQIFTNNIRVTLLAFAGGITAGVLTIFSLVFNGLLLGLVAGLGIHAGNGEAMARLLIPHGVLELSLIVVSGAAGLRFGWALLRPGHRTRTEAFASEGRAAVEMALGVAVLLVPCGLVEGFITPRGLSLPWALAVGLGLGVAFWGTVAWRGLQAGHGLEPEVGGHAR